MARPKKTKTDLAESSAFEKGDDAKAMENILTLFFSQVGLEQRLAPRPTDSSPERYHLVYSKTQPEFKVGEYIPVQPAYTQLVPGLALTATSEVTIHLTPNKTYDIATLLCYFTDILTNWSRLTQLINQEPDDEFVNDNRLRDKHNDNLMLGKILERRLRPHLKGTATAESLELIEVILEQYVDRLTRGGTAARVALRGYALEQARYYQAEGGLDG